MTEQERIEKEAREYCKGSPHYLFEHRGYIAGATAKRDKTWNEAIDAMKVKVKGLRASVSQNEYGKTYFDIAYGSVIMEIECLKKLTPQNSNQSKE